MSRPFNSTATVSFEPKAFKCYYLPLFGHFALFKQIFSYLEEDENGDLAATASPRTRKFLPLGI